MSQSTLPSRMPRITRSLIAVWLAALVAVAFVDRAGAWGGAGGGSGAPRAKEPVTYDEIMKKPRKKLAEDQKRWEEKKRREDSQYTPPTGFTIGNPGNMWGAK